MTFARIGEMRHLITVQENTRVKDSDGNWADEWADLYTDVPAKIRELTSREMQAAGARQSNATVEFETHAGLDITADNRIVFEGQNYDIEPPRLDPTRQRRMMIRAYVGTSDG